jgi:TonB family protein
MVFGMILATFLAFGQTAPDANAVVTPPRLDMGGSFKMDDDYPTDAFRAHAEGITKVSLHISVKGQVTACDVVTSSGWASLDDASCKVLSKLKYKPARDAGGHAVEADMKSSFTWKIPH